MFQSPSSSKSRRSTRVGRSQRGGGGGFRRGEEGVASWRVSSEAARKWVQVPRPPSPSARFCIPTWVPVENLTPEENAKYAPAAPFKEATATTEVQEEQVKKPSVPTTPEKMPPALSREVSEGMPLHLHAASPDPKRPHDPVAATMIAQPATASPLPGSRPVSAEPASILVTTVAGDTLASPVPVTASASSTTTAAVAMDSTTEPAPAPVPFLHSKSNATPFHTPLSPTKPAAVATNEPEHQANVATTAPPPPAMPEASEAAATVPLAMESNAKAGEEPASEPPTKKAKLDE